MLPVRNFDELVKSRQIPFPVIPAEAGIQFFHAVLDPGVRRGDDMKDFFTTSSIFKAFNFSKQRLRRSRLHD
jgi:hypothetical protein